jgi:hypothetical protein
MTYPSNISTDTYHYDGQLRDYIIQFMAVFAGLQVSIGQQQDNRLIQVPIRYGSSDRVVASIKADNTTNKPIRLPTLAAYLRGITMAPESRKGVNVVERRTFLSRGGAFPTDLAVIEREQPIPYTANFDLSIMTSNASHHYQILEQILTLFNPNIQIQTSDDAFDWKRITMVELRAIGLEENFPMGTDTRLIQTELQFTVPIYLSPPTVINKNYIADIKLRLDAVSADSSVLDIVFDVGREFPVYETLTSLKGKTVPTK